MPERWPAAMLVSTAAEYLDCSRDTVEKLIRSGAFDCIQFYPRGDRRILKTEIDEYLESQRKKQIKEGRRSP